MNHTTLFNRRHIFTHKRVKRDITASSREIYYGPASSRENINFWKGRFDRSVYLASIARKSNEYRTQNQNRTERRGYFRPGSKMDGNRSTTHPEFPLLFSPFLNLCFWRKIASAISVTKRSAAICQRAFSLESSRRRVSSFGTP
ncbi:uncharacterized protein LOC143909500 [Arctopsyche grandis]|uniref:uncharacterized protein LOC143909500 n=1 Tax=Arctopsyche grandis TaxID=121162 RepID=UPI00406D9B6B